MQFLSPRDCGECHGQIEEISFHDLYSILRGLERLVFSVPQGKTPGCRKTLNF